MQLAQPAITVYCSAGQFVNPLFHDAAAELGAAIARQGFTLIYGGSQLGLMGTVSEAALAAGGTVIGIMPELFQQAKVAHNPQIELIITDGMRARKALLEEHAAAFIALPGGYGTLEEVLEVLTNKQLQLHSKPVVLLNIDHFYDSLLAQFDTAVAHGCIQPALRNLVAVATTPATALDYITAQLSVAGQ